MNSLGFSTNTDTDWSNWYIYQTT